MKKMIIVFLVLFFITGCKPDNEKNVVYINEDTIIDRVIYSYGGYPDEAYYYFIDQSLEDESAHFVAEGYNGVDLDLNIYTTDDLLEQFKELYLNSTLDKWIGFDGSDDQVLDGFSFYLEIILSDGTTFAAGGHTHYPEDFEENHALLVDFFNRLVTQYQQ